MINQLKETHIKVFNKNYKVRYKKDPVEGVTLMNLYAVNGNIIEVLEFDKITRDRLIYKRICEKEGVKP